MYFKKLFNILYKASYESRLFCFWHFLLLRLRAGNSNISANWSKTPGIIAPLWSLIWGLKINISAYFFFKPEVHAIPFQNIKEKFKKLTCKKMFRFRSSAPFGANLWAKNQHFDLNSFFQKKSSFNVLVEY